MDEFEKLIQWEEKYDDDGNLRIIARIDVGSSMLVSNKYVNFEHSFVKSEAKKTLISRLKSKFYKRQDYDIYKLLYKLYNETNGIRDYQVWRESVDEILKLSRLSPK